MGESTVPNTCRCGGQLEYYGQQDCVEFWRCMDYRCGETYTRYVDTGSGC